MWRTLEAVVREMRVDHLFLRLDGRVFEVLSDESDYMQRVHVDAVGFAVKGPDRDGRYKVQRSRSPPP
jgi:putative aminopeptidase FrvX